MKFTTIFNLGLGLLIQGSLVSAQNVVNIDKSKQYQKMDGFGTQYGATVYWDGKPQINEDHLKRVIDDMGISMHRTWIDPKLEISNDNDDFNNTDLAKYKANLTKTSSTICEGEYIPHRNQIDYMKIYKERALKNGDTINFYASVISPPHWMKYVRCTFGQDIEWNRLVTSEEETRKGGTAEVIKDRKDEYAEWLYATLKTWKDEGLELTAVGLQNEAAFPQPYGSCVYSPEAMAGLVRVTGKRFAKEGLKTKIMFPEDIGDLSRMLQYVRAVNADAEGKKYGEILGVHQYNQDGVTSGSIAATTWASIYKVSQLGMPRPLWMTETSGFGLAEKGMMKMATQIFSALKFGKVNAWNWYDATDNETLVESTMTLFMVKNGVQVFTKKGQAFRHYSKYIRPGSIAVDATCASDEAILPLAFQDNYRKRLTVILINNDSVKTKTVTLKFADNSFPKKLLGYRTSATEDWKKIDSINIDAIITLPPNSISTYIGNNSKPIITGMFTNEKSGTLNQLLVYPNPTAGNVMLQLSEAGIEKLEVMDSQLKTIRSEVVDFTNETVALDLKYLSNGVYYFKVKNQVKKIVISQ